MTFSQFVSEHWLAIGGVIGYVLLTCVNHLPDKWDGFYPCFLAVMRSLAASAPAQRLEAKYSVTAPDGSHSEKSVSVPEAPKGVV